MRKLLSTLGSDAVKTKGFAHKAENLRELYGFDRDTVADFMDNIQSGDTRLIVSPTETITTNNIKYPVVRKAQKLTEVQQRALAHLAEYYDLPVVSERAAEAYAGNAAARGVFDTLNAVHASKADGLRAYGKEFSIENARYARILRSSSVGSEKWLEQAAYSLNAARSHLQSLLDSGPRDGAKLDTTEENAALLFRNNFPEQWRNRSPIEVADIADRLNHAKTMDETMKRVDDGDLHC